MQRIYFCSQGGPFTCEVFDPSGVRLSPGALEGAEPLKPHSFELDTSGCGAKGDLQLDIVHDKRSVMCALEKLSATKYRATFMPKAAGKHRVSACSCKKYLTPCKSAL